MACALGSTHTLALSDSGHVYSFGCNTTGQLGLGHNHHFTIPSAIRDLPRIKQIACGFTYSVCVDYEGFIWSFGYNNEGQLGLENQKSSNVPLKIRDIPPVESVSCGYHHTMIITNDSNLWSCGNNDFGQLCLGNSISYKTFQQTSFSNVCKISLGAYHSLFQNNEGEIYSCGSNSRGELGIGVQNGKKMDTPTLIPNLPPNIIQFVCGHKHNLFLDVEGNVFGVGDNAWGQLALNIYNIQYVDKLIQLQNIPPIQIISCAFNTSFLVDFDGNLWGFGSNGTAQIRKNGEHNYSIPQEIEIKDIKQLSYGCCAHHFLVKDSQNAIFVMGSNKLGQLGVTKMNSYPREMDSHYFPIWGNSPHGFCKAKSARK